MLTAFKFPPWLGGRTIAPTTVFASLFFLVVTCRTLVVSLIPLSAVDHLGSAQAVSVMFLLVSIAGVCSGLVLPTIILKLRTRVVFHLAGLISLIGAISLGAPSLELFLFGMVCWVISTVTFEICLNLYIMHLILRRDIALFEPKRVVFMVTSYAVGPWLGVWLEQHVHHWAPYALAGATALASVLYFRLLGLREAGARQHIDSAPKPFKSVGRFLAQPRLRLAWAISFSRAAWWSTFMFYVPIYVISHGLSQTTAAAVVSAGVAMVYSVNLWSRTLRRRGMRHVLIFGFGTSGALSILVALAAGNAWVGVALLLVAGLVTAALDAAGNTPFLRAVRPLEREAMTGVFSTYRDASQLLPPAVYALVLIVLPIQSVFAVMGLLMITMARLCRHMSPRL